MNFNRADEVEQILSNRIAQKKYRSKPEYKEYNRIRSREWRLKNPIRFRELSRKSRLKRREAYVLYARNYYRKFPKKWIGYVHKWRKSNPAKLSEISSKRRSHLKGASVMSDGIIEWKKSVLALDKFICTYCKVEFPISNLHFDHIVPLSKGGAHSIDNLCVACCSCNLQKHAKLLDEWIATKN